MALAVKPNINWTAVTYEALVPSAVLLLTKLDVIDWSQAGFGIMGAFVVHQAISVALHTLTGLKKPTA
jgi:hypothetical protein